VTAGPLSRGAGQRDAREPERLWALDALRGLMALAVALYHFGVWTQAFTGAARDASIIAGVYSVEGFFILSGLCFFKLYGQSRFDGPSLRGFYLRRFLRIAPLFYTTIALSYLTHTPVDPGAGWSRFAENLTLSFALFHPNHALVLGGWSIGLECVFYALFPVLAWVARRRVWLYSLALFAFAWAVPYNFGKVASAAPSQQFHVYVQLANHAFLFLVGGVIADARARSALRLSLGSALTATLALGLVALWLQPEIHEHVEVMAGAARLEYLLLCALCVSAWALVRGARSTLSRGLGWLGDVSYSLYLMHPFAWLVVRRLLPVQAAPGLQLMAAVVAVLAISACTQRLIEAPAVALGRRITGAAPRSSARDARGASDASSAEPAVAEAG